jgi:beta-lactamase class A
MKSWMVALGAIVCLFIGGIGGYFLDRANIFKSVGIREASGTEVRLSGYRFINPLLECEQSVEDLETLLHGFKDVIRTIVQTHINSGDVSVAAVYFRDLNDGPWFGVNEDTQFSPASLLKIPVLMAYLKQADTDPTLLAKVITYQEPVDYDKDQTIVPKMKVEIGKKYTIEQLLDYMTEDSSNNATYFLYTYVDKRITDQVYTDLNLTPPTGTVDSYTISVRGYSSFFRYLFNASYLTRQMSERALNMMSQSSYSDGLVAGVPRSVVISHKFGERYFENTGERQLHDCGIIYYPKNPYLLCVMTRGKDISLLSKTIADISRHVYMEVDKQLQSN